MSKEARRLWYGDWQGDEPTDTVVITPDDEDVPPPPPVDRGKLWRRVAIVAGVAALFGLGVILATSGNNDWLTSQLPLTQTQTAPTPQQVPQPPPPVGAPCGGGW